MTFQCATNLSLMFCVEPEYRRRDIEEFCKSFQYYPAT